MSDVIRIDGLFAGLKSDDLLFYCKSKIRLSLVLLQKHKIQL